MQFLIFNFNSSKLRRCKRNYWVIRVFKLWSILFFSLATFFSLLYTLFIATIWMQIGKL